nr:hypothetical protein [Tanacetum cinerariifolium]
LRELELARAGDGDDEPSNDDDDDDDDTDDEDEKPTEDEDDDEEEDEHLALADSFAVPVIDHVPSTRDIEAFEAGESAPTPRLPQTRADYPADGGDGDDEPSDDDDDDTDDEDPEEEPFEEDDEEEHPAPADSPAVPIVDLVLSTGETEELKADEPTHAPGSPIRVFFSRR